MVKQDSERRQTGSDGELSFPSVELLSITMTRERMRAMVDRHVSSVDPDCRDSVASLPQVSVMETVFSRFVRDSVEVAIAREFPGRGRRHKSETTIQQTHQNDILSAVAEIAGNCIWYNYAGLTGDDKKAFMSSGRLDVPFSSPEDRGEKPITFSITLRLGQLIVSHSGAARLPATFALKWAEALDDKVNKDLSAHSKAVVDADEDLDAMIAALEAGVEQFGHGNMGLRCVTDVFRAYEHSGDRLTFIASLAEYFERREVDAHAA